MSPEADSAVPRKAIVHCVTSENPGLATVALAPVTIRTGGADCEDGATNVPPVQVNEPVSVSEAWSAMPLPSSPADIEKPPTVFPVAVVSVRSSAPPVIASGAELRSAWIAVELPPDPSNVTFPVTPEMHTTSVVVGMRTASQLPAVAQSPPVLGPAQLMVQGASACAGLADPNIPRVRTPSRTPAPPMIAASPIRARTRVTCVRSVGAPSGTTHLSTRLVAAGKSSRARVGGVLPSRVTV